MSLEQIPEEKQRENDSNEEEDFAEELVEEPKIMQSGGFLAPNRATSKGQTSIPEDKKTITEDKKSGIT